MPKLGHVIAAAVVLAASGQVPEVVSAGPPPSMCRGQVVTILGTPGDDLL
jgi:hypothetical protein